MGIFKRKAAYDNYVSRGSSTLGIASPWHTGDPLQTWAIEDALSGLEPTTLPLTPELALRVPAVNRAHGVIVPTFAGVQLFQYDNATRTPTQPAWLTSSASGISPYHRMYGLADDLFWYAWAALGFTADRNDCIHIPVGMWSWDADGNTVVTEPSIPDEYTHTVVAIPLGFRERGVLIDGADTIRDARMIEESYRSRLGNPVPLTILTLAADRWDQWTPAERKAFRDSWVNQRRTDNGATALKPDFVTVDMPGQVAADLYESGRNAVRLDIANHTALPASMIEGVRQGGSGGGTEMRYQGVDQDGAQRSELWDYGLAKRMLAAVEARLSLDDVCEPGLSIRGDITGIITAPTPSTHPTSTD